MSEQTIEERTASTLISARVFECYAPPPLNSLRGALLPRIINQYSQRRKVSVEVHSIELKEKKKGKELVGGTVTSYEECVIRVLEPGSVDERRTALKRARERRRQLVSNAGIVIVAQAGLSSLSHGHDDDNDDASTVAGVPAEYRESRTTKHNVEDDTKDGWVAKYRFPIQTITIKGTHKNCVVLEITLGKATQVRELIFDVQKDAEDFTSVLKMELSKESERIERKRMAMSGNVTLKSNESITFLVEIISAWDIPVGDLTASDPYVVCLFNGKKVHKTHFIPKTLDPIWTLDTDSLFLWTVESNALFLSDGLVCSLKDFDKIGKSELLAMVVVPPGTLYNAKGERMEFKLAPPPGRGDQVPGYLAVRVRRAGEYDIAFMTDFASKGKATSSLANKNSIVPISTGARGGSSTVKSFITRNQRKVKGSNGVFFKQYRIRPQPDPERPEATAWLTRPEIDAESMKESREWVDCGAGSLGRLFVEIIGCDDLPNMDIGGFAGNKTDAFVSLVYEDTAVVTDVVDDCLRPRWMPWSKRAFIFHMSHSSSQLQLGIFDYDSGINPTDDHDLVGRVSVDLQNMRKDSVYVLTYNIYASARMTERKPNGKVTIRLRLEIEDERKILLSSLEPPPNVHINSKTRRDFRVVRYTCTGKYDMDKYSMKVINSYFEELLSLQHVAFYLQDAAVTLLLWRGTYSLPIGSKTFMLPVHSLFALCVFSLLVERPQLIPSFFVAMIAWLLLATMDYRRRLPDMWSRCKSYLELVEILILGTSHCPPDNIAAFENAEEAQAFREMWTKRIADTEAEAARSYQESLKAQEEYQLEIEEIGDADQDMSTKQHGISVDPFKPILFPIQQSLSIVIRYIRYAKHIIFWEECYISFWIASSCLFLSFAFLFVPWFFLIKWVARLIVWTLFGPWMKLVDVYYVSQLKPLTEEERSQKKKQDREKRRQAVEAAASVARIKRENVAKLKAIKKYLFGKWVIRIPILKEDRYVDFPTAASTAVPYKPVPLQLAEVAMQDAGYRRTRLPSQRLVGDMIPKMVTHGFTEAPVGQATAYPFLVDPRITKNTLSSSSDSTIAAYTKLGSLVAAAAVLTWFGVPFLAAVMEKALLLKSL